MIGLKRITLMIGAVSAMLAAPAPTAPMAFEPNRGQAATQFGFVSRGQGYNVQIARDGVLLTFPAADSARPSSLRMTVVSAASRGDLAGGKPQDGRSHYLLGNSPRKYLVDVPQFADVWRRGVYPGIDLHYYGNGRRLEYDFVLAPGADVAKVGMRFAGHDRMRLTPNGDIEFTFGKERVVKRRPVAYELPGRREVAAAYRVDQDGTVRFELERWDRSKTLVVDPVFDWATYLGGPGAEAVRGIAIDPAGNIYVTGRTTATGFPTASGYQGSFGGGASDAFVTKYNPAGTAIVYSTFLGGASDDAGNGIAVDSAGNAYIIGDTSSTAFPKNSPISKTCASSDFFVTKLNSAGNGIVYSLCGGAGGTDSGKSIALDASNNAYVFGETGGGLTLVNPAQTANPGNDAFVGKINATATEWGYLTYLGGASLEYARGIGADAAGNVCVTGWTWSTDLPLLNALQSTNPGFGAYVVKYTAAGVRVFATYLGGTGMDEGMAAALDGAGNCYVTGYTQSADFPLLSAADSTFAGTREAFVTAYNASGSAYLYSTFLGGRLAETGNGISARADGTAHITGETYSPDFPVLTPVQGQLADASTVFRSSDSGTTFSPTAFPGSGLTSLIVDAVNPQILFAGTNSGIYKSTDGGTNWNLTQTGSVGATKQVLAIAAVPGSPCSLYGGYYSPASVIPGLITNYNDILQYSADCGETWGIPPSAPSGENVTSLAFDAGDPGVLYYGFSRRSSQSGSQYGVGRRVVGENQFSYPGIGFHYVAADPATPCTVYAVDFGGTVNKSTSCTGMTWTPVGTGQVSGSLIAIAVHPSDKVTLLVGSQQGDVFRYSSGGSAWTKVLTAGQSVNSIVFHPSNGSIAYAASSNGVVYKSTDAGATWNPAGTVGPGIDSLAVSPASATALFVATRSDRDAFYAKLSPAGAILDSTFVGGTGPDAGNSVATDAEGKAAIGGFTSSSRFPVTASAVQGTKAAGDDGFVLKFGAGTPCSYLIAPTTQDLGSAAGGGTVAVTTPAGCPWTAVSNAGFLSITAGASGVGSGQVTYSVQANPALTARSGTLTVGGLTFTVNQAALICTLTVTGLPSTASAGGQSGTFTITASGAACAWTAASSEPWLTVTPASGTGTATVTWNATANSTGATRTAMITAGGQTASVTQASSGCAFTLNPATQTTSPAEGRAFQVSVTAVGAGCSWTASSNSAWAEVFPLSGSGNGTVSVTVYPNFGTQQRTATLTIGGQALGIVQSGMTGSADQRFVRRAYFNALKRLPPPADEAFHVARLTAGTTRAQMMLDFINGGEFKAGAAFVTGLYRVLLGRLPEKGGWDFQLNSVVVNGTPQTSLAAAFLTTQEWVLKQGTSVTDAQFVSLMFQEVLARAPSPAELAFQLTTLNGTAASRAAMATAFLGIPEFFARNGNRLNALHAYFVILGRDPTTTELQGLEAQLAAGTQFSAIVNTFVNGTEHAAALQ